VKRVVTGWQDGRAVVLFEGEPQMFDFGVARSYEVWSTDSVPASFMGTDDAAAGDFKVEPPLGGAVFRLAVYPPGASIDIHSTQTVDYLVVISGELTLILEDREIVLRAGDTIVQQSTPHGWANRAETECLVAAVLLTALGASTEGALDWP
jgi:quercetin dioxygenase-like cupin family protein